MNNLKHLLFICFLLLAVLSANAMHIKGGWMYYEYLGKDANGNNKYKLVVKLYRDCVPPSNNQNDPEINIAIYRNSDKVLVSNPQSSVPNTTYRLEKTSFSECINPKPQVCYVILEYTATVNLPAVPGGYTASFQRCCRINGIVNVQPPSNSYGNTYTITLPGSEVANGTANNSPRFNEKDTVAVCYNSPIELDYSATDADGDSLVYSFTGALTGASQSDPSKNPADPPPYFPIPYASSYSSSNPFGTETGIDPNTGIITGLSPSRTGEYVLSVSVREYRNGQFIADTRKELHVNVAACSIVGAQLPLNIISCDGYTVQFENLSSSSAINAYYWDFGVKNSTSDTSTQSKPTFTYADTGVYIAKLVVNPNTSCADSATSEVRVFPGFFPDFSYTGSCFTNPFQFNDKSSTSYGVINSQYWDFGDLNTTADTSVLKNPQYLYSDTGDYVITLRATSNKGCSDTITRQIKVIDKPLLDMAFRDTLICSIDSLELRAIGSGVFNWTPVTRMINNNTATPTVFPLQTTRYTVTLDDRGCVASDTVRVNVLDFITVNAGKDTTICRNDGVQLSPVSQGLQYLWTPSTYLSDPAIKNPVATPVDPLTTYQVTASLGKCRALDDIIIKTVPYPLSNAGNDTAICNADTVTLSGSGSGNVYQWSPAALVAFPNRSTTPAYPKSTTSFILKVYEPSGCPKPGIDTVLVTVVPPLTVFAGNDTSIVIGQSLQLNGVTNGTSYSWSPATGMNNPTIINPVIVLGPNTIPGGADEIRYLLNVSTAGGCVASDDIAVKLFKTAPSIFIPTAFTPNQDGKNDVIKPLLAGMKQLIYFRIYNRYGQLIFETKQLGRGWDGKVKGALQNNNAFVFDCKAEDYTGKIVHLDGSFVLIR